MRLLSRAGKSLSRTAIQALPVVLGIVVLNFLLLQLVPGDAADVIAGESGSATAETMAALRKQFGLDQPVLIQLANYLDHLAHLSLGFSPRYNTPVGDLIMSRLPFTLLLMLSAFVLSLVVGIAFGAFMAAFARRWPDRALSLFVLILYSAPGFWVGLMIIVLFSVKLGWLPSGGAMTVGADLTGLARMGDLLTHLVLPSISLACFFTAVYARLTRSAMLEVERQDFVRAAEAKGLGPFAIQMRHVLRNALIPVTTVAGLHLGNLLGGAIVVETVFGWPGMGRLALDAVMARDFNVLLGVLLLSSFVVIVANVLIDLLHAWLDPRIESV
ncbi:ABC transporter permease [Bradyrhizobium sp. 31Argb]|uniref:ABC transporter permease n=1 Tax=unclassified Bradyrhizobium TaxID=2631580 RepID=UPI00102EA115|nr:MULTISPECIES: ABC transporter permease [unclassified Bradyrhizobium]MDI4232574.1 ABC transporter permease [Bradyrhizobium sp. Arg237L]TAI66390.1 ABC transporter permease [Bradyrhizobium sp. Leo170]